MNRLLFTLCYRLFHHAAWIPRLSMLPRRVERCLCGYHQKAYPP